MILKSILLFITSLTATTAWANLECTKGVDTLKAFQGRHMGDGPTLFGLQLNDSWDEQGYKIFTEILKSTELCTDIESYININSNEVYLCEGEMFALKGAYGQVILTKGAIMAFKQTLAPKVGWKCK